MNNNNNLPNNMRSTDQKIRDFIRYNNTVPLMVAVAIVVSGSAFAATPTGQQAISSTVVGQQSTVVSVDNTLIATVDLTTWTPKITVTGSTEDADNYYIQYTLSTIDIKDYKWQPVDKQDVLKVSKEVMKDYVSLSDYAKYQLKQNIDAETDRLARTQEIEKKNVTLKQTVTSYSGLAGLVLDDSTKVDPPVVNIPESSTPGVPAPTPVQQIVNNVVDPQAANAAPNGVDPIQYSLDLMKWANDPKNKPSLDNMPVATPTPVVDTTAIDTTASTSSASSTETTPSESASAPEQTTTTTTTTDGGNSSQSTADSTTQTPIDSAPTTSDSTETPVTNTQ